jgi:hypothetical protein
MHVKQDRPMRKGTGMTNTRPVERGAKSMELLGDFKCYILIEQVRLRRVFFAVSQDVSLA